MRDCRTLGKFIWELPVEAVIGSVHFTELALALMESEKRGWVGNQYNLFKRYMVLILIIVFFTFPFDFMCNRTPHKC